ncbi:MAG: LssY C-terminal domain-containing protein [Gammaproteobacteria bacterium]|nr:LssY C-terminal domain-containing protein [Gammaproteobacteria bacterium]
MIIKKCTISWRWCVDTALTAFLVIFIGGCATATFEQPATFDPAAFRERAESAVEDNVRVSAAIPSREENTAIFGIDLSEKKVQPVWFEIENGSDRQIYLLQTGLDPEYFSPREITFAFYGSMSDDDKKRLDQHIENLNFRGLIAPHSTASGFVFTNEDQETKFLSVDLLSRGWSSHLTLLVPVPDRSLSEDHVAKIQTMISEMKPLHVDDESQLRTLLEKLPCCTTRENGAQGAPLNLVLIGELGAMGPALVRRHFRYAPAGSLYVFGRPQDYSAKKGVGWVAAQPHTLRVWLTKIRFQGKLVWIGQISMPQGGRFAGAASDDSLPIIDPDIDEARSDLVQDAVYSQLLTDIGFVKGVEPVARSSPRTTPGGTTYHTDGLRAVLIFDRHPTSMSEIEFLSWEALIDHNRQ